MKIKLPQRRLNFLSFAMYFYYFIFTFFYKEEYVAIGNRFDRD